VHEDDKSPPLEADVKKEWSCTSTPPLGLHGVNRYCFTLILSTPSSSSNTNGTLALPTILTSHTLRYFSLYNSPARPFAPLGDFAHLGLDSTRRPFRLFTVLNEVPQPDVDQSQC
jgi:hypothetical protein